MRVRLNETVLVSNTQRSQTACPGDSMTRSPLDCDSYWLVSTALTCVSINEYTLVEIQLPSGSRASGLSV